MDLIVEISRYILPVLAVLISAYCISSLVKGNKEIGITGYLFNEANGDKLPLSGYEVSVGRSKVCDIVLDYGTVSRFHAVLSKHKDSWRVTDTMSKTGTYINAEKIEKPRELKDGDTLVFGNAVFRFMDNAFISPEQESNEEYQEDGYGEYAAYDDEQNAVYLIDDMTNDAYRIDGLITCMIGRGDDVQIKLNHQNVSRRHAMLVFDNGIWSITDMDSQFGTLLNGKPVRRMTALHDGDNINICGITFIFRNYGEAA